MTQQHQNTLKPLFADGAVPDQDDFADMIDSIPIAQFGHQANFNKGQCTFTHTNGGNSDNR